VICDTREHIPPAPPPRIPPCAAGFPDYVDLTPLFFSRARNADAPVLAAAASINVWRVNPFCPSSLFHFRTRTLESPSFLEIFPFLFRFFFRRGMVTGAPRSLYLVLLMRGCPTTIPPTAFAVQFDGDATAALWAHPAGRRNAGSLKAEPPYVVYPSCCLSPIQQETRSPDSPLPLVSDVLLVSPATSPVFRNAQVM